MAVEEKQKGLKSTTVRISKETKKRLGKVARQKAAKEDRVVTEIELIDQAIEALCTKEERKLGIA